MLSVSDFGFADADPGDTLASVRITRATYLRDEDVGLLVLDGVTVTHGAVIPRADIDAGRLRYVPPPDIHHQALESFEYTVSDGKDDSVNRAVYYGEVRAVNDPPTGKPVISGTRRVGQVLTAAADGIEDPDGAPSGGFRFTYQWIQVDTDGASNPTEISGATGSTYTLAPEDLGKRIRVRVSFTDADDTTERVTSDATGTIQAQGATNAAPTGADKTVTTAEDVPYAFQLADFGFADSDAGDSLQGVTVATLPSEGALTVSGEALAAGASASATDIALGRFLFTPSRPCPRRPLHELHLQGERRDRPERRRLHDDRRRDTSVNDPAHRQAGDSWGRARSARRSRPRPTASTTPKGCPSRSATSGCGSTPTERRTQRTSPGRPARPTPRGRTTWASACGCGSRSPISTATRRSVSSTLTGADPGERDRQRGAHRGGLHDPGLHRARLHLPDRGLRVRRHEHGRRAHERDRVVTVPRRLDGSPWAQRRCAQGRSSTAADIGAGRLVVCSGKRTGPERSGYASFTFRVSDGSERERVRPCRHDRQVGGTADPWRHQRPGSAAGARGPDRVHRLHPAHRRDDSRERICLPVGPGGRVHTRPTSPERRRRATP